MRKFVLLFFMIVASASVGFGQNLPVTGTVTSEEGNPLSGVTVVLKGTQTGVITDNNGKFTIMAPANSTLQLSFVGYEAFEAEVGSGRTPLQIMLESSSTFIDNVIVVGYGSAKRVGTVIGSVATIKADKFDLKPGSNVMDALQGQVAGLSIMTSSGEPSATSTFRLHGIGSVPTTTSKNEPLILLDGSPITNATLAMLNPSDFESVNVLKDASATSIYGSRAANGVVYITSKKGSRAANERALITFRAQYSMSNAMKPKLEGLTTDEYVNYMLKIDEIYEANGYDYISPETAQTMRDQGNTDWFKEIYKKNAPVYQVDLSVNGGGRITSYYFSGSYNNTEGISPGSDLKRYNFHSNLEVKPKDFLRAGLGLNAGYSEYSNTFGYHTSDTNWFTNAANGAVLIPSFQKAHDEHGNIVEYLDYTGGFASPLAMPYLFPDNYNRLLLNGNMFVEITPVKNLIIRSNLAGNGYDQKRATATSSDYIYNGGVGWLRNFYDRLYSWTLTNTVEYSFKVKTDHNFTVLAGQESIYNSYEKTGIGITGISDSRFMYINHGTTLQSGYPEYKFEESTYNSIFGRIDYDYKEKYLFDASVRNDASSRFGSSKRNAVFYSVGGMWNIKKENFLKSSRALSQLSLKVSWGTSGNSVIGEYAQYAVLSKIQYMGESGWALSTPGNNEIKWESQGKLTVGVNAELFSAVRIGIDFYKRDTKDMLMDVPIPRTSGFITMPSNVGHMRNTGIDVAINADLFKNKDWYVNFNTTFNYNKNKMVALFGDTTEQPIVAGGDTYMIKGESFGVYKMYEWQGVDQQTGMPMWTGPDGTTVNYIDEAVLVNTGKSMYAPFAGGFGFTAQWKGLALTADFSWMAGRWMANNTRYFSENIYFADGSLNQTKDALDYWKNPGDKAKYPSLEAQVLEMGAMEWDTHLLENASFLRMKNIQLSYSFPRELMQRTKVFEGIRVWVSGRNLLTWTKYKGLDPEVDSDYSLDNYPNSRQVSFGIELTF